MKTKKQYKYTENTLPYEEHITRTILNYPFTDINNIVFNSYKKVFSYLTTHKRESYDEDYNSPGFRQLTRVLRGDSLFNEDLELILYLSSNNTAIVHNREKDFFWDF